MLKRYKIRNYNFRLVIMLVAISSLGVLLVGSADPTLQRKQLIGVIGGLILMLIVSLMDFSWLLNFYWIIYALNIALLIIVVLMGSSKKGASRWIQIRGFQFQPTEVCKILLIMFFAMFLMKHEDDLNTFRTIVESLALIAVPLILIAKQPDLKNTLTIAVIFCILMYVAGLSYKIIGGTILVVIPLIVVLLLLITQTDLPIINNYQKNRIMAKIFSEDAEYSDDLRQQENSITAIGSGQLGGKGLNNNEVSSANKGKFVAESQNDFIFAVAGEELGFAGSCTLLLLLFGIVFECIRMGGRAKDLSGTLICCGMASLVAIQGFINIAVATGLFPNTGTPLPFVSYGLTSLWSLYIGMGLVLNVGLQNRTYPGGEKRYEYRAYRTRY
ncbi:rod shape-determining protein RodA [Blautia liquoris]|uniref:Rod shape-determining protein RodA n=1 Tax=Blautia liquoris TaxID=2779518 RepID=A0A7M2RK53_9FIRM|nr:FtsW/RodA/SpoVE family cell cycle protein [Blautia liquoris]QOV20703.1 rod shape-determining protein RodA [Blautia liquoris]